MNGSLLASRRFCDPSNMDLPAHCIKHLFGTLLSNVGLVQNKVSDLILTAAFHMRIVACILFLLARQTTHKRACLQTNCLMWRRRALSIQKKRKTEKRRQRSNKIRNNKQPVINALGGPAVLGAQAQVPNYVNSSCTMRPVTRMSMSLQKRGATPHPISPDRRNDQAVKSVMCF